MQESNEKSGTDAESEPGRAVERESGQSEKEGSGGKLSAKKLAAWSACALWILSLLLSFGIPINSSYIWLPDAVLLAGFIPLLWICPYSLVWIAYGVLTTFIGAFLLLLSNIPSSALPAETHSVKLHLLQYHPCWTWMIIGVIVTAGGTVKLFINLFLFFFRRRKQK